MSWKEEYIKMIGCSDLADLQIENAQQLKNLNMPRFLYKYRPISDFAIENLRTNTVWLNSPSQYNDPFECVEYVNFLKIHEISAHQVIDEYIANVKSKYDIPGEIIDDCKSSENPINKLSAYLFSKYEKYEDSKIDEILDIFNLILNKESEETYQKRNQRVQQIMKVCSFCESPSQLLMWSHYADFHKGFCIEYDLSKWSFSDIRRRLLYPVIYSEELFDATEHLANFMAGESFNNLYSVISCATKSFEWSYEKEWRFIFNIGPSFEQQNYRMDCQSSVYLGLRIEEKKEQNILEICKRNNLILFKAKQSFDKYELLFDKIYEPN